MLATYPLKEILSKFALFKRMLHWFIKLNEIDTTCRPHTTNLLLQSLEASFNMNKKSKGMNAYILCEDGVTNQKRGRVSIFLEIIFWNIGQKGQPFFKASETKYRTLV